MKRKLENFYLTNHAMKRTQQRGIKANIIELILLFADKISYTFDGSYSFFISKKHLSYLVEQKVISPIEAENAAGVVIIEGSGSIVTAFRKTRRHYKKNSTYRR